MTDCAKYLNGSSSKHVFQWILLTFIGYYGGARYDGSLTGIYHGSCAGKSTIGSWDQQYRDDTRQYIEGQMDTYEAMTEGWVFWNFKTESADEWSLFALLDNGIFPNPVTSRAFPPMCGNYH